MSESDEPFFEDGPSEGEILAREKTNIPGILLIIVGALNMSAAIYLFLNWAVVRNVPPQELVAKMSETQQKQIKELGWKAEDLKVITVNIFLIVSGVSFFTALMAIVAGIYMRLLRAYGLCVTGALLTAVPCLSPLSCCAIGEITGIFALVVLLNPVVKNSFN